MSLPRREHMRRACSRVHALVRIVASPIMLTCVAYMVVATLSCLFVSVQGMTPKAAPPAKPAFAYGLPGNFNAVGGAAIDFGRGPPDEELLAVDEELLPPAWKEEEAGGAPKAETYSPPASCSSPSRRLH